MIPYKANVASFVFIAFIYSKMACVRHGNVNIIDIDVHSEHGKVCAFPDFLG
jgi:hypothetical protein